MALVALNDIWESVICCQLNDQAGLNVRHWKVTDVTGSISGTDIADKLDSELAAEICACMSNIAYYGGIRARRVWPTLSVVETNGDGTNVGTSEAIPLPSQVCGLATLYSDTPGRAGRGRLYVPFPSIDHNAGEAAAPNATYFAALGAYSASFTVGYTVTNGGNSCVIEPVIWTRGTSNARRITSRIPRAQWATQRKRGAYGRTNAPFFVAP